VIDLTWEDPVLIKKSKNLKDSINKGILKKLTDEEYEKTKALQYNREQKELLKQQQWRSTRSLLSAIKRNYSHHQNWYRPRFRRF
jgi:uncharacterized membrane protein YheB (UPF0754 family)